MADRDVYVEDGRLEETCSSRWTCSNV